MGSNGAISVTYDAALRQTPCLFLSKAAHWRRLRVQLATHEEFYPPSPINR